MTSRAGPDAATVSDTGDSNAGGDNSQRLDKWLWCARFFKTRSLAAKFIGKSGVRLARPQGPNAGGVQRVVKPGFSVRPGDELAFAVHERLFVIAVKALAERRGPATEARTLYEDNAPRENASAPAGEQRAAPPAAASPKRAPGAGRPTKKDRRAMESLGAAGRR